MGNVQNGRLTSTSPMPKSAHVMRTHRQKKLPGGTLDTSKIATAIASPSMILGRVHMFLKAALIGAGIISLAPLAMAQSSGADRQTTDGGPPGMSQRYDRGADAVPSQNAPPLSQSAPRRWKGDPATLPRKHTRPDESVRAKQSTRHGPIRSAVKSNISRLGARRCSAGLFFTGAHEIPNSWRGCARFETDSISN